MLVISFNLSQSFNYTDYLFLNKWFKSEINSFCIWTPVHTGFIASATALSGHLDARLKNK